MFAVLVADTDIDPMGSGEPELVGPFDTELDAYKWAIDEARYIVHIMPINYRPNS